MLQALKTNSRITSCVFVLFGALGNLALEKLWPILFHGWISGHLPDRFKIVAFSRKKEGRENGREQMFEEVKNAVKKKVRGNFPGEPEFMEKFKGFWANVEYCETFSELFAILLRTEKFQRVVFYLSIPTKAFKVTLEAILEALPQLMEKFSQTAVILEKPFAEDSTQARETLGVVQHLEEGGCQVLFVDHYLGKDGVQLGFDAFAGTLFSLREIKGIEVGVFETVGVGKRDVLGAIQDMLTHHCVLFATFILALLRKENTSANRFRVHGALKLENARRAQYTPGYLHEESGAERQVPGAVEENDRFVNVETAFCVLFTLDLGAIDSRLQGICIPVVFIHQKRAPRIKNTRVSVITHDEIREPARWVLRYDPSTEFDLETPHRDPEAKMLMAKIHAPEHVEYMNGGYPQVLAHAILGENSGKFFLGSEEAPHLLAIQESVRAKAMCHPMESYPAGGSWRRELERADDMYGWMKVVA